MELSTYNAAHDDVTLRDAGHFGRFRVTGADAAALLHHLTTNDIKKLKSGEACDAALVTSKARLLDVVSVLRDDSGFLVITSPNRRAGFAPHAQKFILYRQDVKIEDVTETTHLFGVFGPNAGTVVAEIENKAATTRLPFGGFWLFGGEDLGARLRASGKPFVDGDTYNVLRVEAGIGAAGLEIGEDFNPWEANLDANLSLSKGCYNGQEVIARLNTYKKVKQKLKGLKLAAPIPMGQACALKVNGRTVGAISSSVESPRLGAIALAYVRSTHAVAGTPVEVERAEETQTATVADLPFIA